MPQIFIETREVFIMEITLQPLRRMLKNAGAKRVSDKAAEELGMFLEDRASALLLEAKKLSEHSGRRTVMRHDIKEAKKHAIK